MGQKLFTCPKCRKAHLGHDPLPDWRACGFDYREREGFRWDVSAHLLSILGLVSFLLVSSSYQSFVSGALSARFYAWTATMRRSSQAVKGPLRFTLRIMM
jgi:hypothetical protein